jgi:hypothetical protein
MKQNKVGIVLLVLSLLLTMDVWGFKLKKPVLKGASGGSVDVNGLSSKQNDMLYDIIMATKVTSLAVAEVQEAVGKKEEAQKIRAVIKEAENTKNLGKFKEAVSQVSNAQSELKDLDSQKSVYNKEAGEKILNALPYLYAGIKQYTEVLPKSKELLTSLQGAVKSLGTDMNNIKKVKDMIDVIGFISNSLPEQISNSKKSIDYINQFLKVKGVSIPSEKELQEKADSLEKE